MTFIGTALLGKWCFEHGLIDGLGGIHMAFFEKMRGAKLMWGRYFYGIISFGQLCHVITDVILADVFFHFLHGSNMKAGIR